MWQFQFGIRFSVKHINDFILCSHVYFNSGCDYTSRLTCVSDDLMPHVDEVRQKVYINMEMSMLN